MATPSGAAWVNEFPGSQSLDDLEQSFGEQARAFVNALIDAGASVTIASTLRPPERAYLMHWSWKVSKDIVSPQNVPAMAGVDILWWHGSLAPSKVGAREMVDGFGIGGLSVPPALNSRHTEGLAVDMSISWSSSLSILAADGTVHDIASLPKDGTNAELIAVGATYGVIHFANVAADKPHWSNDGH